MLSDTNARLAAARRLTGRRGRREAGLFLAEGAQAVREALRADGVVELFATASAAARTGDLLDTAGVTVDVVSERAAAGLSETVTPQGLVAVCRLPRPALVDVLAARPRLVAVLVEPNEPGNVGAVIRTADAAGADAVLIAGGADAYSGKAVRASAGSVFHLPVLGIDEREATATMGQFTGAGLQTIATTGHAPGDLDDLEDAAGLLAPTAWIFGNEARGLPADVVGSADRAVRIPIHGGAESLNLAAAAAVCLYASARIHRRVAPAGRGAPGHGAEPDRDNLT